jgi:hypothetical protein
VYHDGLAVGNGVADEVSRNVVVDVVVGMAVVA